MKQLRLFILIAALLPTIAIIWARLDAAAQHADFTHALERLREDQASLVSGYKPLLQQIVADGVTQSHDDLQSRQWDKERREYEALKQIQAEARK